MLIAFQQHLNSHRHSCFCVELKRSSRLLFILMSLISRERTTRESLDPANIWSLRPRCISTTLLRLYWLPVFLWGIGFCSSVRLWLQGPYDGAEKKLLFLRNIYASTFTVKKNFQVSWHQGKRPSSGRISYLLTAIIVWSLACSTFLHLWKNSGRMAMQKMMTANGLFAKIAPMLS